MDYKVASHADDPDYIVTLDSPQRYYRKVRIGKGEERPFTGETRLGTAGRGTEGYAGGEAVPAAEATTAASPVTPGIPRTPVSPVIPESPVTPDGSGRVPEQEPTVSDMTAVERKESGAPQPRPVVYRYVEIDLKDIPQGHPVEVKDWTDVPDETSPEYVVSIGSPLRYFHKTDAGVPDTPGSREDRSGMDETGIGLSEERLREAGEVWGIRDFESEAVDGRIPVSDAGLVLLHPFIGRMMMNLGLVKKGDFVSPLARIRAVHLLRDLTGSAEPHYSHNLVLEKILCGLPVGYALPPEWKPTKEEKEEIEALLHAVCEYWRPLSKSSNRALCESFILREGTVERFQDTWTVRVEGRTIDILMDDLPWEISIIMLPWLDKPIAVEWQRE